MGTSILLHLRGLLHRTLLDRLQVSLGKLEGHPTRNSVKLDRAAAKGNVDVVHVHSLIEQDVEVDPTFTWNPICVPLWAKDAHPLPVFNPLLRNVPRQTQQNPILQINVSYMTVQDTFL
jgi:hypothetical protein